MSGITDEVCTVHFLFLYPLRQQHNDKKAGREREKGGMKKALVHFPTKITALKYCKPVIRNDSNTATTTNIQANKKCLASGFSSLHNGSQCSFFTSVLCR